MARSQVPFVCASAIALSLLLFAFQFPFQFSSLTFVDDAADGSERFDAVDGHIAGSSADVHIQSQYEQSASLTSSPDDHDLGIVRQSPAASKVAAPEPSAGASRSSHGQSHDGLNPRRDFWSVENGDMLPGDTLTSLNGLYSMNLSMTGELKIFRHYADEHEPAKSLFWTNDDFQWVGSKYARIEEDGIFQTLHHILDAEDDTWKGNDSTRADFNQKLHAMDQPLVDKRKLARRGSYEPWEGPFRTWSTISYPACQKEPAEDMTAVVVLTNTGALHMKHIRKIDLNGFKKSKLPIEEELLLYPICEVFEGERELMAGDMGRLAVVLAGTMRSWKRTCSSLNEKVLNKWPGTGGVDVFVATGDRDIYGYSEDDEIPWLEIQADLNRCLGGRLRLLEHAPLDLVEFPKLEETGGKCNGGMVPQHRLINQVKTVWRGGQLIQDYSIRTGARYDYVLKMRPDHLIWGDAVPPFEPQPLDVISYPMPYWEPPTWSMRHDRTAHSTPSDQMAFGRLLPMMTYLNLYPSYVNLVRSSQKPDGQDYAPCYVPNVPCPDWEGHSPCFIEGLSGYWPVLNGIKVKLDWKWKVNLLREGEGQLSKEWRSPWNQTQGSRYVTNGFE